tara:strand:- start:1576 stop:2382 length:807 start_codon:yes stop_codon:yes gene_type:complete
MISIICPCFNSSNTINGVIDSILGQASTKIKFEMIFIDDGSTDNTVRLLKSGIEKLNLNGIVSHMYLNSHKGPGTARNIGIKNSNYDYIAFIDSDDIWYKNKLEICEKIISKNPDHNIFVHDENYIRENNNNNLIINGNYKKPLHSSLFNSNCFSTSAVILKKELLIQHGGFDEELMSSQDYELWLRLAPYLNPYKINEVLGEYRESTNSITAKFYLYRILDQLRIAYRYRNYVSYIKFLYKIAKIVFSKQWIYGIRNIILSKKSHNY